MDNVRNILKLLLLAGLCWSAAETALLLRAARRTAEALPGLAEREAEAFRQTADARLREMTGKVDMRLASAERRADRRLADAVSRADARIGEALYRADARLAEAIAEARGVRVEAQGAVSEARGLIADLRQTHSDYVRRIDYYTDCENNGLCWQGALTDVLLAGRRAALTIDREVPKAAEALTRTAEASAETTKASAQIASNLAAATRPYPRWVRWGMLGLTVAPAAAQVALPFVMQRIEVRQVSGPGALAQAPVPGN